MAVYFQTADSLLIQNDSESDLCISLGWNQAQGETRGAAILLLQIYVPKEPSFGRDLPSETALGFYAGNVLVSRYEF